MTGLTTHVLDTTHGCAAAGVAVRLWRGELLLFDGATDADGRCPGMSPVIERGAYRLSFAIAAYFRAAGLTLPDPPFLDMVTIDFAVADPTAHYHVPLLVSPFGYSTYRGS